MEFDQTQPKRHWPTPAADSSPCVGSGRSIESTLSVVAQMTHHGDDVCGGRVVSVTDRILVVFLLYNPAERDIFVPAGRIDGG